MNIPAQQVSDAISALTHVCNPDEPLPYIHPQNAARATALLFKAAQALEPRMIPDSLIEAFETLGATKVDAWDSQVSALEMVAMAFDNAAEMAHDELQKCEYNASAEAGQ